MLCCAVLLAIVGVLLRRGQLRDPFPPTARRSADGTTPFAAAQAFEQPQSQPARGRAAVLRGAAVGVVLYVASVTALTATGAAEPLDASGLHWFLRDLLFAVLAATALVLAARDRGRAPAKRQRAAYAVAGAGAAWTVLGIVDMHVFMLFELAHGQLLWDAVFHTAGVWAMCTALLLARRPLATGAPAGVARQSAGS